MAVKNFQISIASYGKFKLFSDNLNTFVNVGVIVSLSKKHRGVLLHSLKTVEEFDLDE